MGNMERNLLGLRQDLSGIKGFGSRRVCEPLRLRRSARIMIRILVREHEGIMAAVIAKIMVAEAEAEARMCVRDLDRCLPRSLSLPHHRPIPRPFQ